MQYQQNYSRSIYLGYIWKTEKKKEKFIYLLLLHFHPSTFTFILTRNKRDELTSFILFPPITFLFSHSPSTNMKFKLGV